MSDFIDLDKAAKLLDVNKTTLLRAVKQGKLQATLLGRGFKTKPEWLQKYVDSLTVNASVATNVGEQ